MRRPCCLPVPGDSRSGMMEGEHRARIPALRSFPPPILCFAGLIAMILLAAGSGSDREGGTSGTSPDRLSIHSGRVECVAFSPDGRLAASASVDGTTKVWDVATRRPRIVALSRVAGFSGVAFSPDGRTLASTSLDGRVVLSDLSTGGTTKSFLGNEDGSVRVGVFSPDGQSLATGGDDRAVHVWDVPSGREQMTLRGHESAVRGLAYSPDGSAIHSASADGRAISWEAQTGRMIEKVDSRSGPLWSAAVSPDGRWVALGGSGGITLRDLGGGGPPRGYRCVPGAITSLQFLPGGTTLASAGLEGTIILWKLDAGELRPWRTLDGQEGRVKAMAVSPDGTTLITGGDDAVLRSWKIEG